MLEGKVLLLGLFAAGAIALQAQIPTIASNGIVMSASFAQPIVPGSLLSIFGTNLADAPAAASDAVLPLTLGGTAVRIDGIPAPLLFVSPTQINLQAPHSLRADFAAFSISQVVVTTAHGSSVPTPVPVFPESPAAFTQDGSGCGPAIAANVAPDGTLSPNSPSNSAAPGDYIAIFGSGLSNFGGVDGVAPTTASSPLQVNDLIILDGGTPFPASYSGVTPTLVGVHQINFQIPSGTPNRCNLPVTIAGQALLSPTVTISVNASRGKCADPPVQSYGVVSLIKTLTSSAATGASVESDQFTAAFPSGPGVVSPPNATNNFASNRMTTTYGPPTRSCPVPGNANLSVGAITISGSTGSIAVAPQPDGVGGTTYLSKLPDGFIAPGTYQFAAMGSSLVGAFSGSFTVGAPIQGVKAGASLIDPNGDQYIPITWTGGSPASVLKIAVPAPLPPTPIVTDSEFNYFPASVGIADFGPVCVPKAQLPSPVPVIIPCTASKSPFAEYGFTVDQEPDAGVASSLTAAGITGPVHTNWIYRFQVNP